MKPLFKTFKKSERQIDIPNGISIDVLFFFSWKSTYIVAFPQSNCISFVFWLHVHKFTLPFHLFENEILFMSDHRKTKLVISSPPSVIQLNIKKNKQNLCHQESIGKVNIKRLVFFILFDIFVKSFVRFVFTRRKKESEKKQKKLFSTTWSQSNIKSD